MGVKKLLTSLLAIACGAAIPLLLAAQQGSDDADAFRIELAELQRLHAQGAVYVIDVRNPAAYAQGHLPGAVSIPLGRIDMQAKTLREIQQPIVTYCRCPEESTSLLAARRLDGYGVPGARALRGGFDAWVKAGGAVEAGDAAER